MEAKPIDVGYVLRRGLAVTLVVAAICAVIALLAGGGGDEEYTSTAAVSVSVEAPPASPAPTPRSAAPAPDTTDRDGDGVTFAPNARDARPETRQQEAEGARGPDGGRPAPPGAAPAPELAHDRLESLAAQAPGTDVEARVVGDKTIEVEASGPSASETEDTASAAADALVRRASQLKVGTPPTRVDASISEDPSPAASSGGSDALGDLGTGLLIGLPIGIALAALLHLISLLEARRARENAIGGAGGQA